MQVGPMVNTVANAFYFHALGQMAFLAEALGETDQARDFRQTAAKVHESFQRAFFDPVRGLYTDGEGSDHASHHANFFPLAFGLVPESRIARIADFIVSKGMACQCLWGAIFARSLVRRWPGRPRHFAHGCAGPSGHGSA